MKRLLFSFALLSTLLAATSCKEILNALIFDVPTGTFVTSTSEGDMYIHFKVLGTCDIYFDGEESKSQEGNCFVLDNVLTITQTRPWRPSRAAGRLSGAFMTTVRAKIIQ